MRGTIKATIDDELIELMIRMRVEMKFSISEVSSALYVSSSTVIKYTREAMQKSREAKTIPGGGASVGNKKDKGPRGH